MPKFTVTRNWIDCVGFIWMPSVQAGMRHDLTGRDLENMRDDRGSITRDSVAHWLALHSGDFQGIDDFEARITDPNTGLDLTFPWENEESECTFHDAMYGSEE